MLQAAAAKGLDFSEARPFDRRWWLKVRLVTDCVESSNLSRVYEMQHRQHCAVFPQVSPEKFGEVWEEASALIERYSRALMPWLPVSNKDDARRQAIAGWQATYGNPNDPEVMARVEATAAALIRDANYSARQSAMG